MTKFDDYRESYETLKMERDGAGVLTVTLHTGGDSLQWGLTAHREIPHAFQQIGDDDDNRVMILTGTGEEFSGPRVIPGKHPLFPERPPFEVAQRILREGRLGFSAFLDIDVPVISCINGPAWRHSELPLLADIVLCSDTAQFQDSAHFPGGLVPGDGMHIVYPLLMGINRARHFLLTGRVLDAQEALDLGLVAEVMPPDDLMPRARRLAEDIAERPASLVRLSRAVLVEKLKREINDYIGFGLYAEFVDIMNRPVAGE